MTISFSTLSKRAAMIVLSVVIALTMMPSLGLLSAEKASAAGDEPVVLTDNMVNVEDVGDGEHGRITDFDDSQPGYPTNIIIPAELDNLIITEIGDRAFSQTAIRKVEFEAGVSVIGESAFEGCPLESFEFTSHLSKIGKAAFKNTKSLINVNLGVCDSLVTIPEQAFSGAMINNLTLPPNLKAIESYGFHNNKLTGTVKIPSKVERIENYAFQACGSVVLDMGAFAPGTLANSGKFDKMISNVDNIYANIKWSDARNINKATNPDIAENPELANTVTPFLFDTQSGLIYGLKDDLKTEDYGDWWTHPTTTEGVTTGGTLKIPSSIGGFHVNGFTVGALSATNNTSRNAVREIVFDSGHTFTEIPHNLMMSMSGLESVSNIPTSVTIVNNAAFNYCGKLESLTFPSVTVYGDQASSHSMHKLSEVTFQSDKVTAIKGFSNFNVALKKINLPNMKKDTLKGAPWNATFATVYWKDGAKTETPVTEDKEHKWIFRKDTNVLLGYLGQTGPTVDLHIPGELEEENGTKHTIKSAGEWGVNLLAARNDSPVKAFNKVTFADSITQVQGLFRGITVNDLDIGKSKLETITGWAFSEAGLKKVTLPESVKKIEGAAFRSNGELKGNDGVTGSITIPGNIISMQSNVFEYTGITQFDLLLYKERDSDPEGYVKLDKKYKKAPVGVTANEPWGAMKAAGKVFYQDQPQPQPRSSVGVDSTNNKAVIDVRAFTTNPFYIVKDIKAGTKMPAVTDLSLATYNGKKYPSTAKMTVSSKTANNIQGGNGKYVMDMKYGHQNDKESEEPYEYSVMVDKFHTLTYNANGGSGTAPTAPEGYVKGYKPALAGAGNMSMAGYTFKGWTENKDGSGEVYTAGSRKWGMDDEDATLYAKWDANTYDVVFNANGGKFKDNKETKTLEGKTDQEILKITGHEQPTRSGYGFVGWATTQGASVANATTVPVNGTTVYAVWKQGTTNAILDANGGKFGNVTEKNVNGTTENKLNTFTGYQEPTREGYTFKGWATSATATTGQAGSAISVPGDGGTKYYAVWQINKYDVTFNGNGGTIGGAATKKINDEYNKDLTKMTGYVAPIREGYNFRGWATSTGATTPDITKVPAKAQTVYAVWQIKSDIKVTLDPNGGEFTLAKTETIECANSTYGEAITELFAYEEPERKYYTFKGWATTADATAANISAVPEANATVYAVWVETPATDAEKDAFRSEIEAVKKDAEETKVSTDGKDVSEKDQWVPKEEKDKIDKAAADAEAVLNTDGVTGKQIAEGSEALKASKEAFEKAKKAGTKEATDANNAARADILKSIEAAEAKIAGSEKDKYTVASVSVLQTAIAKAKALAADPAATTKQLTDEKAALENAVNGLKPNDDPKTIPTEVTPNTPANLVAVTTAITTAKNDGDLKGSTYAPLKFQSKKQTKKSIKLQWSKVKGAKQYTVYANQCGTKNKYKKLATVKGKTLNVKKVAGKKLKKGVSYKFLIIAENGDKVSAISKTLHIRTAGHKKYTNYKSVSVNKTVIKKAKKLKRGKTLKLNAKGVVPKGKKVSVHVKTRYESANKKVATVTKAGKVKGIKKGKAKIYCYVQNGLAKVVTVTVK